MFHRRNLSLLSALFLTFYGGVFLFPCQSLPIFEEGTAPQILKNRTRIPIGCDTHTVTYADIPPGTPLHTLPSPLSQERGEKGLSSTISEQERIRLAQSPWYIGEESQDSSVPFMGRLDRIFVQPGQRVSPGDPLGILEIMKMFFTLVADTAGTVHSLHQQEGKIVTPTSPWITFHLSSPLWHQTMPDDLPNLIELLFPWDPALPLPEEVSPSAPHSLEEAKTLPPPHSFQRRVDNNPHYTATLSPAQVLLKDMGPHLRLQSICRVPPQPFSSGSVSHPLSFFILSENRNAPSHFPQPQQRMGPSNLRFSLAKNISLPETLTSLGKPSAPLSLNKGAPESGNLTPPLNENWMGKLLGSLLLGLLLLRSPAPALSLAFFNRYAEMSVPLPQNLNSPPEQLPQRKRYGGLKFKEARIPIAKPPYLTRGSLKKKVAL